MDRLTKAPGPRPKGPGPDSPSEVEGFKEIRMSDKIDGIGSPTEKVLRIMEAISIRDGALEALRGEIHERIEAMHEMAERAHLRAFNADLHRPDLDIEAYLAFRIDEVRADAHRARRSLEVWLRLAREIPAAQRSRFSTPAGLQAVEKEVGACIDANERWAITQVANLRPIA